MATPAQILQLFKDAEEQAAEKRISSEPSTLKVIKDNKAANTALTMFQTYDEISKQPMPKTYEDLAKIVKIQTKVKPAYTPKMGTAEYVAKSVYSKLVEKPIYAMGEGSAAALEAGARTVGLKGIADYFKESKEMWKTPPATEDVNEQFAWLLESAKKKSTMHGMVVEMAEIGAQIGSLLVQMGVVGKIPGVKAIDTTMFTGTAALPQVGRQMGAMFAHGVATTPGDLSNRLTAGITRMAYNMTPYIANWTGATGWGARLVDTALNTFLTSPSYIKSMKEAKNPTEFMMMALPQFMTDVIFALNTTGTPMNQRLSAMGQRPVVFGQKMEEKEAFLRGVDTAIAETERPYGEEAPAPTRRQVVEGAIAKAKVSRAEEGVLSTYKEGKPYSATVYRGTDKDYPQPVDPGLFGKGTYYTTNKAYAETYGEVKSSTVTLKNPFIINTQKEATSFWDEVTQPIRKKALVEGKTSKEANELAAIYARKYLEDKGYDGVVAKGIFAEGDEVVVFKPEVAKAKEGVTKDIYRFAQLSPAEQFRATIEGTKPAFLTHTQSPDFKAELRVAEELGLLVLYGAEKPYGTVTVKNVVICPLKNKAQATKILNVLKTPVSPEYHEKLGKLLGYSKQEIQEFVTRQPGGALVPSKLAPKKITVSEQAGVNTFNSDFIKRLQRPAPFNMSYKVGTVSDFLMGDKVRAVFKESLGISIIVSDSAVVKGKKVSLGPEAEQLGVAGRDKEGNLAIIVSNKLSEKDTIETILHEAAHMQRAVKGRAFKDAIPELTAEKMVDYVMKLQGEPSVSYGVMLTKTESKKRLALSKKAVADAKMNVLVDPINKGRKLSTEQLPRVASERRNVWEQIKYAWGVLHLGNMRAERMIEELDGYRQGPNTKVGYTAINKAADDKIEGITNDTEAIKGAITELGFMPNIDRFYADRKHVGTRWMLSKTEMVEVYKNMLNPKAIKHLTKSKALNGMGFSQADLAAIKAEVEADPQMKGLADWQIKEYKTWHKRVAPVYFLDTGKILPEELYYSPIMVQKEFLDFEKDNFAQELFDRYHIDGYVEKGFTKARQDGATQPIKLDAIGNHMYNISRMQHYINFALPLKEFREVMNNPRWREAVTAKKGPVFYKNIKSYYDAVAGTKPTGADEIANKAMGFLRTNAGTAMLGFNILTAMRQPLSIFQAIAEIGLHHVLSAIRQFGLNPKGLEAFVYERSKMVKYRQGQFERFMTETEVSLPELLGKLKAPKALTGRKTIRDQAMAMAIFMDKNTVLTTWKAAYDKVQMTGKTLDGELIPVKDLEKAACMEADLAVRRTQPMATVKDLPAWHRSSSWLKMFTMFQNQINNNYNYFAHDIIGKTRAGKITPLEAAQKTLFAYILPAMVLGMIARGGFPRNKKQIAEDLIAFPTSGLFFAGGIINAMVKGYSDYGIPPLQFAPDLVKMVTSKTWATKGKFGLKGLAEFTGIPYNQFARTWKGMQALMAGETDDWRQLIWSEYSLTKGLPKPVKGGLKVFKRKE